MTDPNDKKAVLAAVKRDGWALQFASMELKGDPKIVLAAVKQNDGAIQFASAKLQEDPDIKKMAA
jgi:hypothetical protein